MPTPWNNPYIPGDPYSYDLKWLVRKVKELLTATENFDEKVEQAVAEYIGNLQIPTDYINVMEPRHNLQPVTGDGITDDTEAFKAIIAYCIAENKPLYIPQFCNVLITDDVKFLDMPNLILQGTISGDPALEVQISYDAQTTDAITWDIGTIDGPVLKLMGAKNATIRVQKASELELYADGSMPKYYSFAYNTLLLGNIEKLEFASVSGGWINENIFLNGRMTEFVMDGDYAHNNNIFYRPTFETVDFDIINGSSNYFYDVRLEGTNNIHFHEYATGNVMTRTWLSTTPTVSNETTPYTDDNGTNIIVLSTSAYNRYECIEMNKHNWNFNNVDYLYPSGNGLYIQAWRPDPIIETELIPIDKGAMLVLDSDQPYWRVRAYIYDHLKNLITIEPLSAPLYGGAIPWSNLNNCYETTSNTQTYFQLGLCSKKYAVDTGARYVKFEVRSGDTSGVFEHLNVTILTSKTVFNNSKPYFVFNEKTGPAAPAAGDWKVGDIVYNNAPVPGGVLGWICTTAGTPGTWKSLGTISA